MGNPPHLMARAVVISVMAVMILSSAVISAGPESDNPDLAVLSLKVVPKINHYAISVAVRNIGGSTTPSVDGSVFDEFDLRAGEEELITNFQIPSLDPGEEFSGEFSWTRETTGYHRIWVTADVEGEIDEIDKKNNVAFTLIQLPAVRDVTASIDGIADHDISGSYLSGIPLPVNFSIGYSGLTLPDLLRVYTCIDDGPSRYAPTGGDGISHITYDMGDLSPGIHSMRVNASSSGFPIEWKFLSLSVEAAPDWFSNLSFRSASFNSSLSAYVLGGYIDIPALSYIPELAGIDDLEPLQVFSDQRDIHLTAYILLDGTTTIEIDGDARIETPSSSFSYRLSGTGYYPSPYGDINIPMEGSGEVEIDLGSMMRPGKIDIDIMENISVPLIFSPILTGSSDCSLEVGLTGGGGIDVSGNIRIDTEGQDDSTIGGGLYGPDNPVIYSNLDVEWSTSHDLDIGDDSWTGTGSVISDIDAGIVDVGISEYDPVEEEMVSDMGFDLSMGLDGSVGSVYIPVETGSISSIYHAIGDDVELVHQSNLYKSNPGLAYLGENRTMIVWSGAGSYSTDMMERASSMRLYISSGNSSGDFGGPDPLFHSSSTDSRPVLVRDQEGSTAAIIWQRDLDGDVNTRDDNRIMFSINGSDSWSDPEIISRNEGVSLLPTAFYSTNGDIWAAWSQEGKIAYRVYIFDDGRWSDIKYLKHLDADGVLYNPSLSGGEGELPDLIYVRSGMSWEDDFILASRNGDRARESMLSDEVTITQSEYWMEDPSGYKDGNGFLHVVWRERNGGDGEIFTSRWIPDGPNPRWLPKLRITDDSAIQIDPAMIPVGRGSYMMGWYSLADPSESGNQSEIGLLDVGEKNLSRAAEVVSLELSTDDYSIGDTILLNGVVRNMGMSPDNEMTIILKRLMRDPISGDRIIYDLSMKTVTFHSLLEELTVDFSITIAEHQLGLFVVAEGPRWGAPAYSSSKYISIPAVQDPVIGSMIMSGAVESGEDVSVQIRVDNPGVVPTGDRYISLMSTAPTLPAVYQGNLFEPVAFHSGDPGFEVNRTIVNIGPGSSASVTLNMTILPGRYHIWVEMERYPWEEGPRRSRESLKIDCLPSFGIETDRDLHLVHDLDNFSAGLEITNFGGCSLGDLPVPIGDLPDGMVLPSLNLTLVQNFTSNSWTHISAMSPDVRDIGPHESLIVPLGYDGQRPVRDFIDHSVGLDGFRTGAGAGRWAGGRIIVQERGVVDLASDPVVCVKNDMGNCVTLEVRPDNQRLHRAIFITVYDGYVHDDIVKSQGMATGTGDSGIRTINVPLNLDEGYYTITIVLGVFPDDADNSAGSDPYPVYERVFHIVIEDAPEHESEEEEGYDWEEIQRAALIAAALSMVVFGAAVALKFADKSGEGKN